AKLSTPTTTSPNATASIADKIQAATDILAKDEIAVGQAPNSLMSHESIEGLSLADDTANQTVQNDGNANRNVLKTPDLSSVSKSQSTPAQPTVIAGVGLSTLEATPVRSVPFSTFAPGLEVFQSEQPAPNQPKRASSESECRKTLARITRASTVWFPIGSATLTARSETQLKKLSDELRSCRESEVEVGGHTDRLGADGQNFTLSWKRAEAVAARLIEYGIETDRLLVVGFGPRRPLARPGQSPIGDPAALNRRVEILLR
ncbi:MAG: OmpA family protein, partial [Pseudomonadota bacterium]